MQICKAVVGDGESMSSRWGRTAHAGCRRLGRDRERRHPNMEGEAEGGRSTPASRARHVSVFGPLRRTSGLGNT